MEPQELINEKNELFESLKSEFTKEVKSRSIFYCLFCLIQVSKLLYDTFHHAAITYQLIFAVFIFLYVLIGAVWINWYHKIAKTNNAQEFLTIYNKKKTIDIITTIFGLLALGGIIISRTMELSIDLPLLITLIAIAILIPPVKKKEIEQLRELVQNT